MQKKALISVKSTNDIDDNAIEVVTPGAFNIDEKGLWATYEETEISGMEGTITNIKIGEEHFILEREGTISTTMEFRKDSSTISMYNTPYGMMDITVFTKDLELDVSKNGGNIKAKYDMIISGQSPISTDIEINIKVQ